MIRTFEQHKLRKQIELTGKKLWEFSPLEGEHAGKIYKVATPSIWESYPDFRGYRGEGIYKTTFRAGGNIRLEFKGVSHTATVYLDGKEITNHYNAYTSFEVILKDLEEKEHILEIKADNRFSEKSALHIPNDYMSYGGVSRPVVLEELKDVYLKQIHYSTHLENECFRVPVEITVSNISNTNRAIKVSCLLAGIMREYDIEVKANSESVIKDEIIVKDVEKWEVHSPNLYDVQAILSIGDEKTDDLIDRIGFRDIKVIKNTIYLNNKKVRIKGLCRHEDHPQFGCALPYMAIEKDIEIIENLGANSIRTTHYPNDEIFLDLCDEKGILVWEENHARGLSEQDMRNPYFEEQAENVIKEMLPLHYNHPCIYIWGILNECASETEYGKECYSKQIDLIKTLDTTRPTSFASCKFKTDICFGLPDVVSYNIYPLWYHDTKPSVYIDDLYTWIQKETDGKGKPFLITEIGAGGIFGYHNDYQSKWTEEYQAKALKEQLSSVLSYENCQGVYIWQFCDGRISEEWFHTRPRTMNNKGIVDEFRRRKQAYKVVKEIYESYADFF